MARLKYYSKKTNAWETVDSTFGTGNVKTVNGVEPDANGNIEIAVPGMPEINYPVTSVNGMTGDVVIEVGSGQNVNCVKTVNNIAPDENGNVVVEGGVYVGSGEMPDGYNIQIDPDGEAEVLPTQEWVLEQINAAINDSWEASY